MRFPHLSNDIFDTISGRDACKYHGGLVKVAGAIGTKKQARGNRQQFKEVNRGRESQETKRCNYQRSGPSADVGDV